MTSDPIKEDMQDYPKEVMDAARRACDFCGITPNSDLREYAERAAVVAIYDERRRCAKVASAAVMRFRAKVGRKYYPGYYEDMRVAISSSVLNHPSDSGSLTQGVPGLASKPSQPLSDREYGEKIADRVIAERSDGGLNIITKHIFDDVGGSV